MNPMHVLWQIVFGDTVVEGIHIPKSPWRLPIPGIANMEVGVEFR